MSPGLLSAYNLFSAKLRGSVRKQYLLALFSALHLVLSGGAQLVRLPSIQTVAGTGTAGYVASQDGGPATNAEIAGARGVAADRAGNLYIADSDNNLVRRVDAASGIITTVAGTGTSGFSGDGGLATSATLNGPSNVAIDSTGNLYIADAGNNRIRKVSAATGIITTFASGFNFPQGIALRSDGTLFVSEYFNYCVRSVSPSGTVSSTPAAGNCGSFMNPIYQPVGVAVDTAGNLFIGDETAHCVRELPYNATSPTALTTVAGTCGSSGYSGDGGAATSALLGSPDGVAVDALGNLYIADSNNNHVRKVTAGTNVISTVAGTGTATFGGDNGPAPSASLSGPFGIAVDGAGNVYIADRSNNRIRKIPALSGSLLLPQTVIGNTSSSLPLYIQPTQALRITSLSVASSLGGLTEYNTSLSGCALNTTLTTSSICTVPVTFSPRYSGQRNVPLTVVTSSGSVTFGLGGVGQGPLAALTPGILSTIAGTGAAGLNGDGGAATSAQLSSPYSVAVDWAGNAYIADGSNNRVRKVDPETGLITTVAGNGTAGYSGDGGAATSASFNQPHGVAVDAAGNLYVADYNNNCVRVVSAATQKVSTFAGQCGTGSGYGGDGDPAQSASFNAPRRIALSAQGDLYIADSGNACIRKVTAATSVVSTFAGVCGSGGTPSGDGGSATAAHFNDPHDVALDSAGNVYIADAGGNNVRKVFTNTGIITTVAGNGTAGFSGDGGPATSAELNFSHTVAVDAAGNLYIGDENNSRIRQVNSATGIITTIAGTGTAGSANGPATNGTMNNPGGLAFDGAGNLYIADESNNEIREITVNNSSLSFASTAVGGTSTDSPQTVTLSNIGNAPLAFPVPSSGSNPSLPTDFSLSPGSLTTCPVETSATTNPASLNAGASCTYAYRFTPQQAGTLAETSAVSDGSLNSSATQTVTLNGTSTQATPILNVPSASGVHGGTVTITASIAYGGVQPTGVVSYLILTQGQTLYSGSMICSGTASPRMCTAAITNFSGQGNPYGNPNTYEVAVNEAADSNYMAAYGTGSLQIATYGTTLTVAPLTITYGQPSASLGVSVAYNGPTAPANPTLVVDSGTSVTASCAGTASPMTCMASYATTTLGAGSHTITATAAASQYYNSTTSTATLTVQRATPTVTASVAAASVTYGTSSVTATAALSYPANAAAPSGTVTFTVDGVTAATIASCTSPCSATLNTANLGVGTHTIVASITADTNYSNTSSNSITLTVTQAQPVVTASISSSSISFGTQSVTLSASVSHPANTAAPTGAVTFTVDGTTAATIASCAGTCSTTLNTTTLAPGSHAISASLAADTNYLVANSSPLTLAVTKAQPAITASITPVTSSYGTPSVTLNATVTHPANAAAPAGAVTVTIDGATAATITSCASTCSTTLNTTTLAIGTHTVIATLAADVNYVTASSTQTVLSVAQAQPAIAASVTPSAITFGTKSVMLAASLTHPANAASPTGAVTFTLDGATVATVASCANTCSTTLNTATLAAGPHTIAATLAADVNYQSATSPVVTLADAYAAPSCALNVSATSTPLAVTATVTCTDPQKLPLTTTTIAWGDGTSSPAQPTGSFAHAYQSPGTYTVAVTSTDSAGMSGSAQQMVTPNQNPVCSISASAISTALTGAATVSCKDPQNLSLTAAVTWGDGTTTKIQPAGQAFYTYKTYGMYTVSVTATDSAGLSGSAQSQVTFNAPPVVQNPALKAPVCSLNTVTSAGTINSVSVTASCSGPANDPLTQTINWGENTIDTLNSSTQTYSHHYEDQSTQVSYTVTLTATDSVSGLMGSDSKTVLVSPNVTASSTTGMASQTYTVAPQPSMIQVTYSCYGVTMTAGGTPVDPSLYGIGCNQPQATASQDGTTNTFTMTFQTTPATVVKAANGRPFFHDDGRTKYVLLAAFLLPVPGIWLFGMGLSAERRRRLLAGLSLSGVFFFCLFLSSCGSSFTAPPAAPTPSGRYYLTIAQSVTGNQSSTAFIQNSLIVPLCVQGTSSNLNPCP